MAVTRAAQSGLKASGWTATLIGAVGVCLWATETALVSFTSGLPPFEIAGLAFAVAALLSPLAWWITGESPGLAFRQPWSVWVLNVPSLVSYHACIYFAIQKVPAAPAALLQGCTPLFIVFGSALLPGHRLRWWHIAGVIAGLEGLICLSMEGRGLSAFSGASASLGLIGFAAGLWGIYSLISSRLGSVPTSAMGIFYGAAAVVSLVCHGSFEQWVAPSPEQWTAIAALGLLPMGLALFCWDFGIKNGDVRTLGVISYVEPLIGAGLVIALGQGEFRLSMLIAGFVIIGGAIVGSANFLEDGQDQQVSEAKVQVSERSLTIAETPLRSLELSPELWRRAGDCAFAEGKSVHTFVHDFIAQALADDFEHSAGRRVSEDSSRTVHEITNSAPQLNPLLRELIGIVENIITYIGAKDNKPNSPESGSHRRHIRGDWQVSSDNIDAEI